jgi:hypothetical protein
VHPEKKYVERACLQDVWHAVILCVTGCGTDGARTAVPGRLPAEDEDDGGDEVDNHAEQLWEPLELEAEEADRR